MSSSSNGANGVHQGSTATLPPPVKPQKPVNKEAGVTFTSADGFVIRGALGRMTRHSATFEIYSPTTVLSTSEALSDFNINLHGQVVYSGRAVIRSIVDAGAKVICEATLDEAHWLKVAAQSLARRDGRIAEEFKEFLREWQKLYLVSPEFKVAVADMQTILNDLQLWLNQVEVQLQVLNPSQRMESEQDVLRQVGQLFVPAFDRLHEKLEAVSKEIPNHLRPAHGVFCQRQLHPLVLCSPFGHRAFSKPLGYAGDYGMVNMIASNPFQGPTLFAKIVNLWFLSQWPSQAHRNRLVYLKKLLESETLRTSRSRRNAKIFNFACGPAVEIQNFVADFELSSKAEITLADFNQETLDHLEKIIGTIKVQHRRQTHVHFTRKNVHQLLKESVKKHGEKPQYDLVYCAGLFDYLPDSTCLQMMAVFYEWLAPGGLLAVTNVVDDKPFRHMLEFVLDWHLIYRDVKEAGFIFPESIPQETRSIKKDPTGVNIFIEARKPCE